MMGKYQEKHTTIDVDTTGVDAEAAYTCTLTASQWEYVAAQLANAHSPLIRYRGESDGEISEKAWYESRRSAMLIKEFFMQSGTDEFAEVFQRAFDEAGESDQ